jgi:hypothetical protein
MDTVSTEMEQEIHEIHVMLTELMDVLRPLKAMAQGLGPVQKIGMSPKAREAAARIKAMG